MSSPAIVAVITGRPDSLEAVRWAAWLSQHSGLPLTVVHAYHGTPAGPARARLRGEHDSEERARAREWLRAALDESPSLPFDLRLVVMEGDIEDAVDPCLNEDGVLVTGSHGPAGLVSWGSRVRRCPVVVVPSARAAAGPCHDSPVRRMELVSGVPA